MSVESLNKNDFVKSDLPEGWIWTNLGELGLVRLGKTPRKADYRNEGELKIVKFRDIKTTGEINWDNIDKGFVDTSPVVVKSLKELSVDDVLVTASAHMSEHIGKKINIVNNIPKKFSAAYVVGEILQVRVDAGFFPKWVLYYLQSSDGYKAIQRRVHGVHLIGSRAKNIEIPIAPLDQQKLIVAEIEKQFSRLDEAVASLKRVKANLKRYKAAVLKAAVEGKLTEEWRKQHPDVDPADILLERILAERREKWQGRGKYKEPVVPDTTDLPKLPEGWVWTSTMSIGDVIGGLTKNRKREALPNKFPYLRVANVYANELRLEEIFEIGVSDKELEKLLLKKGDLLVVEGNGSPEQIGRLAVWNGSISPCVHQNHLIKVRLSKGCIAKWALNWFLSPAGRSFIRNVASSTSGLYTLSVGKVGRLPLALPPIEEQQQIVIEIERCLSIVTGTEMQIDRNLRRADRLRQSILKKAFSGQLAGNQ